MPPLAPDLNPRSESPPEARRRLPSLIVGGACAVALLMPTSAFADVGVADQVANASGGCTTTVAGWTTIDGGCSTPLPPRVRKAGFTVVGAALLGGIASGAKGAWFAVGGAAVGNLFK